MFAASRDGHMCWFD